MAVPGKLTKSRRTLTPDARRWAQGTDPTPVRRHHARICTHEAKVAHDSAEDQAMRASRSGVRSNPNRHRTPAHLASRAAVPHPAVTATRFLSGSAGPKGSPVMVISRSWG